MGDENDTKEYIRDSILDTEEMKKIFVGGITSDTTEDEIKKYFEEESGVNVIVQLMNKKEEKKSHFCFVSLATSESVDELLLKKKTLNFKGRKLDVNRAVPKNNVTPGAHEKTKKLFVANMPKHNCTEEQLQKYLEARHPPKFGTIESVQLIKKKDDKGNKTEENKGYGFVLVSSEDMADKMAIQHSTFDFGGRRIEMKKSVPTAESKGGKGGKGRGGQESYGDYGNYGGYGYQGYGGWDESAYGQGYGYGPGYSNFGAYPPSYGGGYGPPMRGGRGAARGAPGRYHPY